ncbi:methyltransferase [Mesorhizobium sp. BAC0120]|uniref:methyltransferase n=1 Tax=Mesorhizobium sp. BAC0120 TaxID=3090670 RepID=UPI003999A38E
MSYHREGQGARLHPAGRERAGDFFESVPSGDLQVIEKVVHDWDDRRAATILRNCRKAMLPNGKVLVGDARAVGRRTEPDQRNHVVMLTVTGGLERMEAQDASLFDAAGPRLEQVIQTQQPISILEALPFPTIWARHRREIRRPPAKARAASKSSLASGARRAHLS